MAKTYIIAEAGVNHNGSVLIARTLIDAAKECGADAVKFQTFKAEKIVSREADKAEYQKKHTAADESQYQMIKKYELTPDDHIDLINFCRVKDIDFLSSPFDEESADLLEHLGVRQFKIPSGEITNHPFLRYLAQKGRPMILSTGMSTMGEIEEALNIISSTGNYQISLLHCVTEYPAPFEEINLRALNTMKLAFGVPVGYSDHTPGIEIPLAAVALGAVIIEKHITLNKTMEGPDHKASLEPHEFKEMVAGIRNVERALGNGIKKPAPCELKNMPIVRKSLFSIKNIKKDEIITKEAIAVKRPGLGILPKDMNNIIGLKAKIDIEAEDVITWDKLK